MGQEKTALSLKLGRDKSGGCSARVRKQKEGRKVLRGMFLPYSEVAMNSAN